MKEYLENLKIKYNYDDKLMAFLEKAIPAIIKFYGKEYEPLILEAIENCEIHIQDLKENTDDYLNSYFNTNKKWKVPFVAGAFYHKEFSVNGGLTAKNIVYIRSSRYMPFEYNENKMDSIIHEICHLVKGYKKEKLINGKIFDSSGLMKDVYTIDGENEITALMGLEEALNCIETAYIMETVTGHYEVRGYKTSVRQAELLYRFDDLIKVIRHSQFTGDNAWIDYLGVENAKFLADNFEILSSACLVPYPKINTPEKREKLHEKLLVAHENIMSFVKNYTSKRNIDKFETALENADNKIYEMAFQMAQNVPSL